MQEKRSEKRIPIGVKLSVSDLYTEYSTSLVDTQAPIEVTDISPKGFGFLSTSILPVGCHFIANIELDRDLPQIITDVRIIRGQAVGDSRYQYGCEFVSISPRVSKMLDDFEKRISSE